MSGVPPSRSVTTGAPVEHREPVGVLADHAAPLVGHHEPSTRMTELTPRTTSSVRSRSTVDESAASVAVCVTMMRLAAGALAVTGGDELLAHRLDRHVVVGEGRRDLGEHTRAVLDVEADVVPRLGVAHR